MATRDTRTNLNPPLAITFLVVALTGMMMLFHMGGGGIHNVHEWMSVAFLILCIVHLCINWKLLWAYLKRGPISLTLVLVFLLSAALLLGGGDQDGRGADGHGGVSHGKYLDYSHGRGK